MSYELGKDICEIKAELKAIHALLAGGGVPSSPRDDEPSPYGVTHKTTLNVDNHTLRDLWIKISGDNTAGPSQVNNGSSISCNSDKIVFGNRATYNVEIWRNNSGGQGSFIGGYSTSVRYNAAGYDDTDELIIVTVGGETLLRVLSAREAGAVIAQIILAS